MWEYKIIYVKYNVYQELIDTLNNEGKDNWEVISFTEAENNNAKNSARILFKRKILLPTSQIL